MNTADVEVALYCLLGAVVGIALGASLGQICRNVPWLRQRIIYGQWRKR